MAGQSEVQVSRLLNERGLSSFQIKLLIWSFFIVLIDGYDIGAIAFAAPSLIRAWNLKPGELGPLFSASLVGILFGSALFGWVGDQYGRKAALVGANLLFGIFTFAAAYATNLSEMSWLRLLAGFGIGGVIPNVVAINAESAPRHLRATLAIIAVGFVPIGGAIPGFITATLVPIYGWPILFKIGGIVPILIGIAGMFGLPESIKYMALHESQRVKMENLIAAIRPGFIIPPNARFVIEDEKQVFGSASVLAAPQASVKLGTYSNFRLGRLPYFLSCLCLWLVFLVMILAQGLATPGAEKGLIAMFVVINFILAIGRFHDIGSSGWWVLLFFVPIVGLCVWIFLFFATRPYAGFNPSHLFRQGLALITPLLWLLFALNLMGYFFLLSWTPTVLTAANLPPTVAALAGAVLQVGGTVGALTLCWWLQRHRFLGISLMFVLAVPVVGSIGFAGLTSEPALLLATFFAGFLVLGIQSGINVVGAMIYPTSLRANGSGWELGMGRIGSIVGPLVGAVFVGMPVQELYMWSALPFAVGAVVCFIVHQRNTARLAAHLELRDAQ